VDEPSETAAAAAVPAVAAVATAIEGADDEAASPAGADTTLAGAPSAGARLTEAEPELVLAAQGAATEAGASPSSSALDSDVDLAAFGIFRGRPRGVVYVAVAVAAVVVVIASIAISGGFSPHPKPGTFGALAQSGSNPGSSAGAAPLDTAAAAVVTASAQRTLAQRTADVALSGTATGTGAALPLSGDGHVDFSAYAIAASLNGGAVAENEIATSSNIYLQLALGGRSMIVESTGRHWINIPIAQGTDLSENITAYSLPWSLQLLAQQPSSVVSLGTRTIGGVQCNGYQVLPSTQALVRVVQQEWVHLGLPAQDRGAAMRALQKEVAAPITAWFDPHRQLACEMTVDMQLTNATTLAWSKQPTAAIVQLTADFTRYGVPVHITAPAGSDSVLF